MTNISQYYLHGSRSRLHRSKFTLISIILYTSVTGRTYVFLKQILTYIIIHWWDLDVESHIWSQTHPCVAARCLCNHDFLSSSWPSPLMELISSHLRDSTLSCLDLGSICVLNESLTSFFDYSTVRSQCTAIRWPHDLRSRCIWMRICHSQDPAAQHEVWVLSSLTDLVELIRFTSPTQSEWIQPSTTPFEAVHHITNVCRFVESSLMK